MAFVQSAVASDNGAGVATLTLNGVVAGNAILVGVCLIDSFTRTFTVSSSLDGSFGSAVVSNNPSRGTYIFALHNASSGNHTITVTINTGTQAFETVAIEWSGLDSGATPITSSASDASSVTTHYSAASGQIDTSGATAILALGVLINAGGTLTEGASYTRITSNSFTGRVMFMYDDAASAVTDERGTWTSSTARADVGAIAAFPYASGGYTLTCDPGSYAVTGSAATLRAGRRLSADPGSYAVTGSDASLRVGHVLVTDAGAYAITGSNASLLHGRSLTADPGSYAVTGSPVTNLRGYVLTADPGDYDLTGVDATLIASGDYSITAEPGSYTITGVDATLLVHRLLTAAPGSYTVTGLPATLTRTHFTPAYVVQTDLIRRMRRAAHVNQEARWLFHRALQIDLEAGVGLVTGQGSDPQIMLRWSDDGGQTWSNEHWTSAGRLGEYQRRAIWRRLGRARDRVYEIAVSDPIAWHQLAAILDIEEGTS